MNRSATVELCWWSRDRPQIVAPGRVQPLPGDLDVVVGVDHRLGQRQRLGVEVDVVPGGERAAPVEDHGVDRHGRHPTATRRRLGRLVGSLRPWTMSLPPAGRVGADGQRGRHRLQRVRAAGRPGRGRRDPRRGRGRRGDPARHRGHLRRPPRPERGAARRGAAAGGATGSCVATKFGMDMQGTLGEDHGVRGSRRYVRRAVEASLRRLRTDHIDLYQLHAPDPVDADRGDPLRARRPGPRGQGALRRLLQLRRLAGRRRRVDRARPPG